MGEESERKIKIALDTRFCNQRAIWRINLISQQHTRPSTMEPPKTFFFRWQRNEFAFPFRVYSSIVTPHDKRTYCCHWQCHYGTVNKRCSQWPRWTRVGPEGHQDNLEWKDWSSRGRDKTPLLHLLLRLYLFSGSKAKDGHMLRTKPMQCLVINSSVLQRRQHNLPWRSYTGRGLAERVAARSRAIKMGK